MITIPDFTKGDSVTWETVLPSEYRMGWTLQWGIRGEVQLDVVATQTPPNTTFFSTITTIQSNTLTAGGYWWVASVTKDDQRKTLAHGELTVKPDLFAITSYDGRTTAQKMLDEVNKAISLIVNEAKSSYKINDREFTYQNLPDLTRWRDKLRIEVKREQSLEKMRQGLADSRIIHSRFT